MPESENNAVDVRTKDFLDVEAIARNLAGRLERLDEEALRYSSAASKLDQAAQSTRELATAVREIGDSATKAIEVVASVGGPEIVARLERVSKAIQVAEAQATTRHSELLGKSQLAITLAGAAAVLAGIATVVAFIW